MESQRTALQDPCLGSQHWNIPTHMSCTYVACCLNVSPQSPSVSPPALCSGVPMQRVACRADSLPCASRMQNTVFCEDDASVVHIVRHISPNTHVDADVARVIKMQPHLNAIVGLQRRQDNTADWQRLPGRIVARSLAQLQTMTTTRGAA